mmetsp:Transcript_53478/g.174036  ORF Transcript_53478/g.174036 Transcript_53478/m.174036 type:complete len:225 (+) Transcript_53478:4251-4925(+)
MHAPRLAHLLLLLLALRNNLLGHVADGLLEHRQHVLQEVLDGDACNILLAALAGRAMELEGKQVRQGLEDLILLRERHRDVLEEVLALGVEQPDLAAAESRAEPQELVREHRDVDDGASVVDGPQSVQDHVLDLRRRLAGQDVFLFGLDDAEGQVDEVAAGVRLGRVVGGLREDEVPEAEDGGRGHVGREEPHERAVEDRGQLEAQCIHLLPGLLLVPREAALQ